MEIFTCGIDLIQADVWGKLKNFFLSIRCPTEFKELAVHYLRGGAQWWVSVVRSMPVGYGSLGRPLEKN